MKATVIKDVKKRQDLFGHQDLITKARDPLLELATQIDELARVVRDQYETEVEPTLLNNYEKIAQLRNKDFGTNTYPDATSLDHQKIFRSHCPLQDSFFWSQRMVDFNG